MKFDKNSLLLKYTEFMNNKTKLEELMNKAKKDTDFIVDELDYLISYINDNDSYDIDFIYDKLVSLKYFIRGN